MPLTKCKGN